MSALTEEKLLEAVNRFRKAAGLEVLDELLPADGKTADSCLVATNLNCHCVVHPLTGVDTNGTISSSDERLHKAAAELGWMRIYEDKFQLPADLAEAALMFDIGEWPGALYPDNQSPLPAATSYGVAARQQLRRLRQT